MKSIKKLSKNLLKLLIISVILIFLNDIVEKLYSAEILTLTSYKYIFISLNVAIIIIAIILKKKVDNMYRTLTIIMISVCNLLDSLMIICINNILIYVILCVLVFLSLTLLFTFLLQSADD